MRQASHGFNNVFVHSKLRQALKEDFALSLLNQCRFGGQGLDGVGQRWLELIHVTTPRIRASNVNC